MTPERLRAVIAAPDQASEEEKNEAIVAMRADLVRLRLTARLLFQNSVGCAEQHHGLDVQENGLPGWLRDFKADLDDIESRIPRCLMEQKP